MKSIVYTNDEGWVSVVTPNYPPAITSDQENEIAARVQQKDVPPLPDGSMRPSFVKDTSDLEDMQYFFESWRLAKDGSVSWHKPAADEIKKKQFRLLRKPILEALDIEFMLFIEKSDNASMKSVAAKKQALRDVTAIDLSAYTSPKSLNNFIPVVLKP
jgi:hypothetical protein